MGGGKVQSWESCGSEGRGDDLVGRLWGFCGIQLPLHCWRAGIVCSIMFGFTWILRIQGFCGLYPSPPVPSLGVSAQLLVTRPSLDFCLYFIFIAEFPISNLSDLVYLTGLIFLKSPLKLRLARLNFQVLCV